MGNVQFRQGFSKPAVKLADGLLLIEERDHHAENRRVSQDWPGGGLAHLPARRESSSRIAPLRTRTESAARGTKNNAAASMGASTRKPGWLD